MTETKTKLEQSFKANPMQCPFCGIDSEEDIDDDPEIPSNALKGVNIISGIDGIVTMKCGTCKRKWKVTYRFSSTSLREYVYDRKMLAKIIQERNKLRHPNIHRLASAPEIVTEYTKTRDFCPFCGAKLRKSDKEWDNVGLDMNVDTVCHACKKDWRDTYVFDTIDPLP